MNSLQHLNPLEICLIGMCLEIGDFSIPDFVFKLFEEKLCKGDKFLFVRLNDPSRTWLPKYKKLLQPSREASASTVHGVPCA